jgi:molybdenum cofactor cytidylyltransferase
MNVVCAILAAGASTRMGTPKQLLEIAGRPLLARIVEACCASRCSEVAVVLGAAATSIATAYQHTRAQTLHNPQWAQGLSTSLHCAVSWAQRREAAGLLVCACDQPLLSSARIEALCAAFVGSGRSVASSYGGTRGVPAILSATMFARALRIEGDRGAGALLRAEPGLLEVPWPEGEIDLDTPEQVHAFRLR